MLILKVRVPALQPLSGFTCLSQYLYKPNENLGFFFTISVDRQFSYLENIKFIPIPVMVGVLVKLRIYKMKDQVWNKTEHFCENYCLDECGALIRYSDYGNRNSKYGWEIDHIIAKNNGGGDQLSNLRALHWENNMNKSDGRLNKTAPKVKAFRTDTSGKILDNARKDENGDYYWM